MKKLIFFISFLITCFLHLQSQERVYMPLFEVMNMHPDYQYSTTKLFKTYVDNNNKYQLVLPLKYDTLFQIAAFEEIMKEAAVQNCSYFIQGEFNRLGDVVVINITMYSSSDGKKIWHSISKALTPDDIDPILSKMAMELGNPDTKDSEDIYNVSNYDSRELNRIGANRYFGMSVGGGYIFMPGISKNFPAGFGISGSYDIRDFIFNVKGEAFFSDANIYYMNIEANYPLSSKKNSAFLSGAMGYGGVNVKDEMSTYSYDMKRETGLFLFLGGGYLVNRNSNVALKFSGNLYTPFLKVDGSVPVGVIFTTTLLFGK